MTVFVPRASGFCYGVSLAVNAANDALDKGKKLYMYGEVVHNPYVTDSLIMKGAKVIDSIEECCDIIDSPEASRGNSALLIRAHGITKKEREIIDSLGIEVIDKTCPKVERVHNIVSDAENCGKKVIVIGDSKHPEVIGIVGQCLQPIRVISSVEEAYSIDNIQNSTVVSQTTFNVKLFHKIVDVLRDKQSDIEIFNTICPATEIRQKRVDELSKNADIAIVVGGKKSSNTNKLYEVTSKNCESYIIENFDALKMKINSGLFDNKNNLLLCGGSSTPFEIIEDIAKKICEIKTQENTIIYC